MAVPTLETPGGLAVAAYELTTHTATRPYSSSRRERRSAKSGFSLRHIFVRVEQYIIPYYKKYVLYIIQPAPAV